MVGNTRNHLERFLTWYNHSLLVKNRQIITCSYNFYYFVFAIDSCISPVCHRHE